MPGIFGVCNRTANENIENLANRMQSQLEHNEVWFSGKHINHQSDFHGIVDFKSRLENGCVLQNGKSIAIYGDIYSFGDMAIDNKYKAETLLTLYDEKGLDFFKHLNGSFIISIFDLEKEKVIIANDRYGSKNLFHVINSDRLIYSSEIKAILEDSSIKPILNHESVVEFFTFSFMLGNKTLFNGIELFPPASILVYNTKSNCRTASKRNKIQIVGYWDLKFNRNKEPKNLETYLTEFNLLMEKAVERRMADKDKIGLFLSDGVDSRLIAGFAQRVAERTGKELISFTFGTKGGWQEKIAKQVADKLGIENGFYEIPADMIANYAEEVVLKGDGHMRIRDAHFISLLDEVRSESKDVLVGFLCGTMFGKRLHEDIQQISSKNELVRYLINEYEVKLIANHIPAIFSEKIRINLGKKVRKNFVNTVMEIPFDSYSNITHYWEIRQRGRRYMLPMSNYIEWYVNAMDPYLDNEVVDFAVNLPLEIKIGKKISICLATELSHR